MTYTQAVWLIILAVAILLVQILILARRKSAVVPVQNEAFDLPDRPRRFRTGVRIILMVGGLGMLIGVASYFISLKYYLRYTATAYIEVIPQSDDPLEATTPSVNSDIQYQLRNTRASLLRPETVSDELLRSDRIRKTQWFRQFTKRGFDSMENSGGDIVTLVSRYLQRHLLVTAEKDSPWIWVAFSCYGPSGKEESTFILNEIVQIFFSKQSSMAQRKFIEQKMVFYRQRTDIQRALDTAQGAIKGFLDGSTFSDLLTDTKDSYLSSLLVQLELRRFDLDSQIASIDRKIQLLERPVSKTDDDSPVHGTNMQLDSVGTLPAQVIAPTDSAKSPTSQDKTPSATPDSATIRDLRQERAMFVSQLETLQQKIQETKKTLGERTRAREQINPIRARRDAAQRSLDSINKELEKFDARAASPSFVGLYPGRAIVPEEPSGPLWYVHISTGFMCGLFMGLPIALLVGIRNARLRHILLGIRRLGVPQLGEIGHEDNEDDIDGVDLSQVVRQAPFSMMSEDYRKLRITLRQQESAADKKILLVTSPTGEDGKTTVVSNLALILINEGRKVLFIDANFRKPTSLRIFPLAAEGDSKGHADFGLSNYLLGQCTDPRGILRPTGIDGLDVIDSGPVPPNPIAASVIRKLLDTVRDAYDFVLIDGPAMLVRNRA